MLTLSVLFVGLLTTGVEASEIGNTDIFIGGNSLGSSDFDERGVATIIGGRRWLGEFEDNNFALGLNIVAIANDSFTGDGYEDKANPDEYGSGDDIEYDMDVGLGAGGLELSGAYDLSDEFKPFGEAFYLVGGLGAYNISSDIEIEYSYESWDGTTQTQTTSYSGDEGRFGFSIGAENVFAITDNIDLNTRVSYRRVEPFSGLEFGFTAGSKF